MGEELPQSVHSGLQPIAATARKQVEELCGVDSAPEEGLSDLADTAARHVIQASSGLADLSALPAAEVTKLGLRLDDLAARVSRNGFQIMDLSRRPPTAADGLFHRISFFNHCCGGLNNASWTWDGKVRLLSVKACRDIAEGEELTISYIAKPWSDFAKPARQRYLQQNFNFTCLCTACCRDEAELAAAPKEVDASKKGAKPQSRLASMMVRWMEGGRDDLGGGDTAETVAESMQGGKVISHTCESASAPANEPTSEKPKKELTDEDRIARVLKRCDGEGLEATVEEVQSALKAEDNHVGKALIRIRRARKAAAATDAATGAAAGSAARADATGAVTTVPCGAATLGAVIALSIGAAVVAQQRMRK